MADVDTSTTDDARLMRAFAHVITLPCIIGVMASMMARYMVYAMAIPQGVAPRRLDHVLAVLKRGFFHRDEYSAGGVVGIPTSNYADVCRMVASAKAGILRAKAERLCMAFEYL